MASISRVMVTRYIVMSYLHNFVLETCWKASCKQIISPRYYKVMNLQDDLVMNPVY